MRWFLRNRANALALLQVSHKLNGLSNSEKIKQEKKTMTGKRTARKDKSTDLRGLERH